MNKPCKACVWPCCCRPELKVFNIEGGHNVGLGRIEMPCQCFDKVIDVYNAME